ncbi:MAG: hypothetical protein F6K30_21125 [Cyanothece sp. SIO2G6]|nr:hypothetical protein [Cyanothece sp. SIO2G6]
MIEGFPRSANSFSVGAFQFSQASSTSVANHLHAVAQIIRATRFGIPAILLIRSPVSAVLSLRSLNFQTVEKRGSYHPALDANVKTYLVQWIRFYSRVKPFHNDYIIGVFDEVTSDFGTVVDRVNRRFSTSFELFEHTFSNVRAVHEAQGYHAGPSSQRQDFKQRAKQELEAANCEALIAEANALYQEFVELAHQQTLALSQQNPQSP